MSINSEFTPLIPGSSIRENYHFISSVSNKVRGCYSLSKRKIVNCSIISLCVSGAVSAVAGIGWAFFKEMPIPLYVVGGGGLMIGVVSCFGAGCLYLNRPQIITAEDLEAQQHEIAKSERLDQEIINVQTVQRTALTEIKATTDQLSDSLDVIITKASEDASEDAEQIAERTATQEQTYKRLVEENPDLFSDD